MMMMCMCPGHTKGTDTPGDQTGCSEGDDDDDIDDDDDDVYVSRAHQRNRDARRPGKSTQAQVQGKKA